ncbi:hypothetical protein ACLKA7_000691 [Drosophila subpalustris]
MAVDPRNHCYCKDRCGDPCYSKDGCKVLAAAKTEMGSLILQGFKTGDWILATVRIAEEALLLKTGGLIIATVRIAEDSGLLKGLLILATVRTFDPCYSKTGGLILATGRIAEESLLLEGLLILANCIGYRESLSLFFVAPSTSRNTDLYTGALEIGSHGGQEIPSQHQFVDDSR